MRENKAVMLIWKRNFQKTDVWKGNDDGKHGIIHVGVMFPALYMTFTILH